MKITENTTLGELINILGDIEKADKTPTSKALRETAEPLADMQGCTLYANGYAVYDNCCGRTVMWIRSCVSFTLRDMKMLPRKSCSGFSSKAKTVCAASSGNNSCSCLLYFLIVFKYNASRLSRCSVYIMKPEGKPTLVNRKDKRQEINTAMTDFKEEN